MDTDATSAPTASTESAFRGVVSTEGGKYRALLYKGNKKVLIGSYVTREEAARAHDREAKKRFGDQAVLNFLPTGAINPCRFTRRARGKRKSMYKGVCHLPNGSYQARVWNDGRLQNTGSFATELEAAKAYDEFIKQHRPPPHVLNFLPDGSLNPQRHDVIPNVRSGSREAGARRGQGDADNVHIDCEQEGDQREEATSQEEEEESEDEEDSEESDEEEEEEEDKEEDQEGEKRKAEGGAHEEGGGHKRRRLSDDDTVIDLTDDGPSELTASSASSVAASAASKRRRATGAVGGGGPEGSIPPLRLSVQPMPKLERASALPQPSIPTHVKVEAAAGVAPASAAPSTSHGGLKMTLLEAVNILGAETFTRLTACERGSEQMASLDRLMDTLQQLHREARGVSASASSSASSATSTADLRTFLLASVCPKYTAEEFKTSHLDNVMQISTGIVKL